MVILNPKIPGDAEIWVRRVEPSAFDSFLRWYANRDEKTKTKSKAKVARPFIEVYLWGKPRRRKKRRW